MPYRIVDDAPEHLPQILCLARCPELFDQIVPGLADSAIVFLHLQVSIPDSRPLTDAARC